MVLKELIILQGYLSADFHSSGRCTLSSQIAHPHVVFLKNVLCCHASLLLCIIRRPFTYQDQRQSWRSWRSAINSFGPTGFKSRVISLTLCRRQTAFCVQDLSGAYCCSSTNLSRMQFVYFKGFPNDFSQTAVPITINDKTIRRVLSSLGVNF